MSFMWPALVSFGIALFMSHVAFRVGFRMGIRAAMRTLYVAHGGEIVQAYAAWLKHQPPPTPEGSHAEAESDHRR